MPDDIHCFSFRIIDAFIIICSNFKNWLICFCLFIICLFILFFNQKLFTCICIKQGLIICAAFYNIIINKKVVAYNLLQNYFVTFFYNKVYSYKSDQF